MRIVPYWACALGLVLAGCAIDRAGLGSDSRDAARDAGPDAPACARLNCAAAGAECGFVDDGCGDMLDCGGCPIGETCGAMAMPHQCGIGVCKPRTCAQLGAACGFVDDGCGTQLDCAFCTAPDVCLSDNTCCAPMDCSDVDATCGAPDDGCGTPLDCGACRENQACDPTWACGPCPPGPEEANETRATAYVLSNVTDDPNFGPESFRTFYHHRNADEDWFVFDVTDGMDGGPPRITIGVDDVPPDNDVELEVWFRCASNHDADVTCRTGGAVAESVPGSNNDFFGCHSTNGPGASEEIVADVECTDGTRIRTTVRLYIYSTSWGSCAPYTLTRTIE